MLISDEYVPDTSPTIAKMTSPISFHMIQFKLPSLSGQRTQISMIAGKASPKMLKQKAPNKLMKSPSSGTAAATKNVKMVVMRRNKSMYLVLCSEVLIFTPT